MLTQNEAIQIAKTVIANNFPELASKRIKYVFVAGKEHGYYMAVQWLIIGYRIYIEKRILKFSPEAFTGCLAHELAHLVLDSRESLWGRLWAIATGKSSDETAEERNADLLAIDRGFGKALLQFHQEHDKKYVAYNASEGMTKREIKKMLKKL